MFLCNSNTLLCRKMIHGWIYSFGGGVGRGGEFGFWLSFPKSMVPTNTSLGFDGRDMETLSSAPPLLRLPMLFLICARKMSLDPQSPEHTNFLNSGSVCGGGMLGRTRDEIFNTKVPFLWEGGGEGGGPFCGCDSKASSFFQPFLSLPSSSLVFVPPPKKKQTKPNQNPSTHWFGTKFGHGKPTFFSIFLLPHLLLNSRVVEFLRRKKKEVKRKNSKKKQKTLSPVWSNRSCRQRYTIERDDHSLCFVF